MSKKGGIVSRTWPTEVLPVAQLAPADYNPRRISKTALRGFEASLARWGLVQPIVWNKQTGRVVGGHQRLQALAKAGAKEIPCVVVDPENANNSAATSEPAEDSSDTQATIGSYRFTIAREKYEAWIETLRQDVGFDEASIIAELERRLGL